MKKFIFNSTGLLSLCLFLVGCNPTENYTKLVTQSNIESGEVGPDAYHDILCTDALDIDSCLSLKDMCQPAYFDLDLGGEKKFKACIPNPTNVGENNTPEVPVKDDVKDEVKDVVKDEVKDDVKDEAKDEVKEVVKDKPEQKEAPKDTKEIVKKDPKDCLEDEKDAVEEDSELANIKDCSKLDPKFLYMKDKGQPKVTICHASSKGHHAIVVACSALKAHINHQDGKDYLGACKEE